MKINSHFSLLTIIFLLAAGIQFCPPQSHRQYADTFDENAADLRSQGINPYFNLTPGFQLTLEGKEDGKQVILVISVLQETKVVEGIETRIVEERESAGGEVVEVSRNFFAISARTNNVYYFGEEVDMVKNGKITGHSGSWISGKNGARYGLMMPGSPLPGSRYYQELALGVAMDRSEIVITGDSIECAAGKFVDCVKTEETTPLEPDTKEYKVYARDIGLVQDGVLTLRRYGMRAK